MKKIWTLLFVLTAACATPNPLKEMRFIPISGNGYTLFTTSQITLPGAPLKIYIEGDGHAFDRHGQPTDDPTPQGTFVRELAAKDTSPNVVYLARPCQYIKSNRCRVSDWTTGRYNSDAVHATQSAILTLMKKARAEKVILIGYSGGAQMALFFADTYPEKVQEVITVAGVLHHEDWTAWHKDMPLSESLSSPAFASVPMRHFVGTKDDVVPVDLAEKWTDTPIKVKGASHDKGFDKIFKDIWKTK